jgi:Spy/CpxP family protein refolding chaperone
MKLVRALVVTSVLALAACGGSVEQQQPATTAQAVSKAPVGANTHGIVKVFGDALGEVELRADQRTQIEQLATDAEARHAPTADGRKDLMNAFADMVEKGSIDRAALQPKVDRVTGELVQVRDADRAALVKLHDILDKKQRDEFADALEGQFKHAKHGGWGAEGEGKPPFAHLRELGKELNLSDDQKDKIHDVVKDAMRDGRKEWKDHHGHHGNPVDAFREDKFDLDKAAPPQDLKALGQTGVDHIAKVADKVLPILTPEQRKIAADKIREMANRSDASLLMH